MSTAQQAELLQKATNLLNSGDLATFKSLNLSSCLNKIVMCVTLLHRACELGKIEFVKHLMSLPRIDINFGETPLHIACVKGHVEIVKLLLERPEIEVNKGENWKFHETPLGGACRVGNIEIMKMLLAHPDTDVNVAAVAGLTALEIACNHKQLESLKVLLECSNLDINKRNVLVACGTTGFYEGAKLILTHPNIDPNDERWNPLANACDKGRIEIVRALLDHPKTNPNLSWKSPLYIAIEKENRELRDLLLEYPKVDINCHMDHGHSILSLAYYRKDIETVKLLCKRKNLRFDQIMRKDTILHDAISENNVDFLKMIQNHPNYSTDIKNEGGISVYEHANNRGVDLMQIKIDALKEQAFTLFTGPPKRVFSYDLTFQ